MNEFWRLAWQRAVEKLGFLPAGEYANAGLANWEGALEAARGGDWDWLDELVNECKDPNNLARFPPPPCLWNALNAFFASPPARARGKKKRFDDSRCESIRFRFVALTTHAQRVIDEEGCEWLRPPMKFMAAYRLLGSDYAVQWYTIRDIVKQQGNYRQDVKP